MTIRMGDEQELAGWRRMVVVATTPPFSWYLLGQTADTIGVWMQRLAMGWVVWEMTGSAGWLGVMTFLKFAPTIALGLIGGVLADRASRRRIIIAVQAFAVVKTLAIVVLMALGWLNLALLLLLEFAIGTAIALGQASSKTIVSELVPAERLGSAIALNSVVFNTSTLIGPAIAGAVMLALGTVACFAVIAALFAIHLIVICLVVPDAEPRRRAAGSESMGRAILAALRYSVRHDGIGPMLALHLAFTLCARPLVDLIPAFVGGELGGGVDAVSLLTSMVGAGAVIAGIYLAQRRPGPGLCWIVMATMVLLGIAMLGYAAAPSLAVAAPLAALIGAGMSVRGAGIQTLVQLAAAENLRGRVLSFYGLVLNGGAAIGGLAMGLLADAIGLREAIAVMTAAALLVSLALLPRRRRMEAALEGESRG
jgi:MFS family permease